MRPEYELAQVVREYKDVFLQKHYLSTHHLRTLYALEQCRTAALGGHIDACDACGHIRASYNSCRNRHCPKCQNTEREKWIMAREEDLLPVSYFHLVFTLPSELNALCLHQPAQLYAMLFSAVWETLKTFSRDPKHMGAESGMIAVLHTWGQQLWLHPHLHCIMPGGGLSIKGRWKGARNDGKYLFPVKALSIVFRGKYLALLKQWFAGRHETPDKKLMDALYGKPWVVYAKQPFLGPKQVIEYLGRYTHKIAISNHRITEIKDSRVSFRYKDYRDGEKQKVCTLEAEEFLRRFCLHILPSGFRKIRHYGILSNRRKNELKRLQKGMGVKRAPQRKLTSEQVARERLGYDSEICPHCGKAAMRTVAKFLPGLAQESLEQLLRRVAQNHRQKPKRAPPH